MSDNLRHDEQRAGRSSLLGHGEGDVVRPSMPPRGAHDYARATRAQPATPQEGLEALHDLVSLDSS